MSESPGVGEGRTVEAHQTESQTLEVDDRDAIPSVLTHVGRPTRRDTNEVLYTTFFVLHELVSESAPRVVCP